MASEVPDSEDRGGAIRRKRVLLGITQAELAQRAGVTITTLYRAEQGLPLRGSSLEKIAKGLDMTVDDLYEEKPVMDVTAHTYVLHRSTDNGWFAPIDRRRNVPEGNTELVRSPQERRRLGSLGLAPIFICYPNLVMPDGPGATLIEVYGRYPHGINADIYRDCMIHCVRGSIRLQILDEVVELGEGDFVGFVNRNLRWIEPAAPVRASDPTPLALWFGAVRLGRIRIKPKQGGRREARKVRREGSVGTS